MAKKRKQAKPDYIYQCHKCGQIRHEQTPCLSECCGKRMSLTAWTNPIKYPEEIKAESQARILKLSEIGKLHTLKTILNTPDQAA